MLRLTVAALSVLSLSSISLAAPLPKSPAPDTFLVDQLGLCLLGADGKEKERLEPLTLNGALSPDGRWLAGSLFNPTRCRSSLVIRSQDRAGDPVTIPHVWGAPGKGGSLPVWAADGNRLLIGENQSARDGKLEYSYRVYDRATKSLTDLKLPDGCWVTSWSPDGKRFVATVWPEDGTTRIAWVAADGARKPEFITLADESAYNGRLSGDGKQLLCMIGPKAAKDPGDGPRLTAIELATGRRTVLDEPGHTYGHCWSPDGSMVAYTWQRPMDDPAKVVERETHLITCTAGGKDRKTVTTRKQVVEANSPVRAEVTYFFSVVDWR